MQLIAWTHAGREGFCLRGWHSLPSGKPLLHFLHGNGFCGRAYEPMLHHLSRDFDLWLCDLQGHGDSDHGGPFVGWNRNAALAGEAFAQKTSAFARVPHFAVGHSFGGVLTGLLLGQHPRLFSRAVLLDPVLFSPAMVLGMAVANAAGMARLSPLARQARARRHRWPSRDEAFAQLRSRGIYKTWTAEALRAFVRHGMHQRDDGSVELKCQPAREAEVFASAPQGLWRTLKQIRTPTLLIHAQNTFPFVSEGATRLSASNAQVDTLRVPGSHCFMQEDPAMAAQRIRDFLIR